VTIYVLYVNRDIYLSTVTEKINTTLKKSFSRPPNRTLRQTIATHMT